MPAADPQPSGRRARRRAETTAEILAAARLRLAEEGAPGVNLRAIARDLDTGVSSLYRYFASRDDLITALLVESFDAQADAVEAATAEHRDAAAALRAALHAYRSWSLANTPGFALAYGTPVPGYRAPAEQTLGPGVRVGGILIDLVTDLWQQGRLDADRVSRRDQELSADERAGLEALAQRRGYDAPASLLSLIVDLMVRIHGLVAMEVFGQLRPFGPGRSAVFSRTVDDALADLGLDPGPRSP